MAEQFIDFAFPRDFLCEHTTARSRVFVLLEPRVGRAALRAVLTCSDRVLAQRAADVLKAIAYNGPGRDLDAAAAGVLAELPAAPAASFRQALERARAGRWGPDDDGAAGPDDDDDYLAGAARRDAARRTPEGARLGRLTGPVIRVIQLREYHVHDVERLLSAAIARGWQPPEEDQEGTWLAQAVLWLALADSGIPGTDMSGFESEGEQLFAERGDEVAARAGEPVIAEFGGARRQAGDDTQPEFAALFGVQECDCERLDCAACTQWQFTPRTAHLLHTALAVLAQQAWGDLEAHGGDPVTGQAIAQWQFFADLSPVTWTRNEQWRREVARACDDLAGDIAAGARPVPRNIAEEVVLRMAIKDAPGFPGDLADGGEPTHDSLPVHRDDYDWDGCAKFLFTIHGVGDTHPAIWFEWFPGVNPRDPDRGFRRMT